MLLDTEGSPYTVLLSLGKVSIIIVSPLTVDGKREKLIYDSFVLSKFYHCPIVFFSAAPGFDVKE